MTKRILVIKKEESIVSASAEADFSLAEDTLTHKLKPDGYKFDTTYSPIPLKGRSNIFTMTPEADGFDYRELNKPNKNPNLYIVRVDVSNEEAFQRTITQQSDLVVGYYSDLEIEPDSNSSHCGEGVGNWHNVYEKLGLEGINFTGKNIRIAIVDSGIAADNHIKVADGWTPPNVEGQPGGWPRSHGTMCAFDALIAAPDAKLLDCALLRSREQPIHRRLLSDAIACFSHLSDLASATPEPLIVNNSWGVYDRSGDYPIGHPGNYSANIDHPFNQAALSLVAAGADVLFSAGNCGGDCPSDNCGINDRGIGRSIHGAKALPDVITVAAVTIDNRRLGYSSQGPAGISTRKPDIAAYSHFEGSGVYSIDNGTSAACPVASGVVAALREKVSNSSISPYALKAILQRTAIDTNHNGWDHDIGYGIINPQAAFDAIES
jgi:subtilisin family serine protease